MGEYEKHIRMAREKLEAIRIAFEKKQDKKIRRFSQDNLTGLTGYSGFIFGLYSFPEGRNKTQSACGGKKQLDCSLSNS